MHLRLVSRHVLVVVAQLAHIFVNLRNKSKILFVSKCRYGVIQYPGVENMKVAVMGCIVNGPGESKHADIGISLPGSGESPIAPVFIRGEKAYTLRGDNIADEFRDIIVKFVAKSYGEYSMSNTENSISQ